MSREGFPLISREVCIRAALSNPTGWDRTEFRGEGRGSGDERSEFRPPIGKRRVHWFWHEEVLTLHTHLGKPVGWVDYKHDVTPELERAIHAFDALGLLRPDHKVKVGVTQIPFRDAFMAAMPEPSTLIGPLPGALGIVVEVHGTKADGTKSAVRATLTMEHREANRRRGTTAERFLTAAASAAAVMMIHSKRLPRAGVLAPEELPTDLVVPELAARGVSFAVGDLPL